MFKDSLACIRKFAESDDEIRVIWNVGDIVCWECGMLETLDVGDVGCLGSGMFGMLVMMIVGSSPTASSS